MNESLSKIKCTNNCVALLGGLTLCDIYTILIYFALFLFIQMSCLNWKMLHVCDCDVFLANCYQAVRWRWCTFAS